MRPRREIMPDPQTKELAPMAEQEKLTFYLDKKNIAAVRRERLRRIKAGTPRSETTVTRLINGAIEQAFRPAKGGR